MSQIRTVVGVEDPDFNTLEFQDVDFLKSAEVGDDGRIYLTSSVAGREIQFAMIRGEAVKEQIRYIDGEVVLNDVVHFEQKEVLSNGSLVIGEKFSGAPVTVAVRALPQSAAEAAEEGAEKQQPVES